MTLYANTTSWIIFSYAIPISSDLHESIKKTYSTLNHFRFFNSVAFSLKLLAKESQKDKQITRLKMFCKRLVNWLVLFDDFFCDTTQLVNLSCMAVHLPFSLLSFYIFSTHYLFYFDYRQYSIIIFKWLTCCLRAILFTWFRLGSLGFPSGFPKIVYLSIFSESTLAGVSVYNQVSILDAQSNELE